MNIENFSLELNNKSSKIGINLSEEQIIKFYKYMNMLIEWNEKINLTAITEPSDIVLKHFIDSLTINKYVVSNKSIIDVGTGAGFPGIPLSMLNEDINITLLDSLNKRINFLNEVIEKIEIENVTTIHSRVEDFAKDKKEKYDIATSRAVAGLNILLEYLLPLIKIGGKCICMKGSGAEEEIENAKNAIKILGGEIEKIEKIELPDSDIKRTIIIIKKIKETPSKYPRKAGIPSREPII